jgi:ADP-ribosylglycohydrolase
MTAVLYQRARLELARNSLDGLSVGDALGAREFVHPARRDEQPWEWTGDTQMAAVLVRHLSAHAPLDQDLLAAEFAEACDPRRGYGAGAYLTLHAIAGGTPWRDAAGAAFDGQGSCGNGAAMRVAPLGAYHAGDPATAAREAVRQAELTHRHPEGVAGATAVAVAASLAAQARLDGQIPAPAAFLEQVLAHLPAGTVTAKLSRRASTLLGKPVEQAARVLGNGSRVTAQDTVPFTLWIAATHLADYPAALRACFTVGGDMDTTGAIVGGIVAAHTGTGVRGVPEAWVAAREPLP